MKCLILLSFFIVSACASQPKLIEEKVRIGDQLTASRYSNLYFSGQPTMKDIEALKKQGFAAVINLRHKSEYNEAEEAKAVTSNNMTYKNVAFSKNTDLSDLLISKITEAVVKNRSKGKVLVHCSSGNRVGVWLGGHFHKDHQYSKDKSRKVARKLGLQDERALEKLDRYLEKH